jgi:hypothetical protein
MKKQKKNEKMKRIKNAENAEKVWKATRKKKRKRRNLQYVIQCLFFYYTSYARIYIHCVIEKNEFSSRINVDHDDAQNKTCYRC